MIFPVLKTEDILQINDKTRLDASGTYISPDEAAITLIEVEPEASAGYLDITSNKYIDWQYDSNGEKVVTLRITTDSTPIETTATITVKSVAEDNLFSNDNELVDLEDDILKYVRNGRNSYLDKHRRAQQEILNDLDANKYWKRDGTRYTASDIVDIQEFKEWSIFLTLKIICRSLSNQVDDLFNIKSNIYSGKATSAKKRAVFRLDYNNDGEIDESGTENIDNLTTRLIRK